MEMSSYLKKSEPIFDKIGTQFFLFVFYKNRQRLLVAHCVFKKIHLMSSSLVVIKQFMHVQLNPDNTAIKGTTGLPSSVWVVCCAFTIISSVYQTSETKGQI